MSEHTPDAQPPYGQQPYGSPPAGQPGHPPPYSPGPQDGQQPHPNQQYPAQPYGQQYPTQQYPSQPYGQQPYPAQPYGHPQYPNQPQPPLQPSGYGHAPTTTEPEPDQKLGFIALVVVGVCAVVFIGVGYVFGSAMGQLFIEQGLFDASTVSPTDPALLALADQMQPWFMAGNVAMFAGIAGWITGMVAVGRRRGKTYGIWAIILGVLAPILAFVAMVVGMWPAVQALA